MNNEDLKHVTELALIRSIPDLMVGELKPGRLKNLMNTLQAAVDIDLSKLVITLSITDGKKIESILEQFKTVAKFGKQKHVGTLVSFCLALIEKSDKKFNDKIVELLNLICEYYERVGDLHVASMWSGDLASERWNAIFETEDLQKGQPCNHPGCLAHTSHQCEGCGRINAGL